MKPEPDSARPPNASRRAASRAPARRGVAAVAFVAALLVVATFVLWVFQSTAASSRAALGHHHATGALFAAESGIEFALRELSVSTDLDGDGAIGTVSNDGNDANNPTLGQGSFGVSQTGTILTASGTWQQHTRVIEVTVE